MTKARDPRGPWEPPTLVKDARGWIDPCPLWDDDGSMYLVHAWAKSRVGFNSVLSVNRLSPDGRQVIDEGVQVFDGHAKHPTIEGPKFYKRNGYYYIFAPAGGVKPGWQTVLRSRQVLGPYEDRVVLAQGSTAVNGPHQGAWIDTPKGESWFVHFQDRGAYGRIVHLQPMRWKDDWPVMGTDPDGDGTGEPVLTFRMPDVGPSAPAAVMQMSDEFNGPALGLQWQWQANPQAAWWSLAARPGALRLTAAAPTPGAASLWPVPNLLLQKFPAEAFEATALVSAAALDAGREGRPRGDGPRLRRPYPSAGGSRVDGPDSGVRERRHRRARARHRRGRNRRACRLPARGGSARGRHSVQLERGWRGLPSHRLLVHRAGGALGGREGRGLRSRWSFRCEPRLGRHRLVPRYDRAGESEPGARRRNAWPDGWRSRSGRRCARRQPHQRETAVAPVAEATSYDVYFGTTDPPPFRVSQRDEVFLPGPLETATTYYWRVDAVTASGKAPRFHVVLLDGRHGSHRARRRLDGDRRQRLGPRLPGPRHLARRAREHGEERPQLEELPRRGPLARRAARTCGRHPDPVRTQRPARQGTGSRNGPRDDVSGQPGALYRRSPGGGRHSRDRDVAQPPFLRRPRAHRHRPARALRRSGASRGRRETGSARGPLCGKRRAPERGRPQRRGFVRRGPEGRHARSHTPVPERQRSVREHRGRRTASRTADS